MEFNDLHDYGNLNETTIRFSAPVTGLAAFRWFGSAKGGIEKMRSLFFQRSKNSGVPVTQPAGRGGESSELIKHTYSKTKLVRDRTIELN